MPLTPAEVHNVAFKKPPIGKRGYDEEEVDAFLDIVEVELSRLIEENNELRAHGGSGAPAAGSAGVDPALLTAAQSELAASKDESQRLAGHVTELEKALSQGKNGAQQQVVQLQQELQSVQSQLAQAQQALAQAQQAAQVPPPTAAETTGIGDHHIQAVQVLAMAQATAEQHLSQSKAEAEKLLGEAESNAQSQVTEAQQRAQQHLTEADTRAKQLDSDSQARAAQVVRDAEQRAATITAQFEQRKAALERRVEELRVYEREYRTRLRSYLESQLRDLDASGKTESMPGEGESQGQ
ncbi:MAG TPA: DivIVA domain-containing protein [Jatrophihabitans sp.]|jgi:DivIVA domain-containing protein